jgi:hypothetical protein
MFNKMMGASEPDFEIVIPKYERIHKNACDVVELFSKFIKSEVSKVLCQQFPRGFTEIRDFIDGSVESLNEMKLEPNDNTLSGEDLHEINSNPEKLQEFLKKMDSKYKLQGLGEKYTKLKSSFVIKEMIMIARSLKNVVMAEKERTKSSVHNLEKKDSLSAEFILNCCGDYLKLFNFTSLDFKQIWFSDLIDEQGKKYILHVLHYIYVRVMIIVRDVTSPDIDVEKFSEIVSGNIEEMRKCIPRCDKAFDKIKSSVGLLKENFGEYYKDFVTSQSGNPGVIIENFVADVAKKNTADLATTRQFKEIIKFYNRQISGKKVTDPKVKKMLSLVGENLDILEGKLESKPSSTPTTEVNNIEHPFPLESEAVPDKPVVKKLSKNAKKKNRIPKKISSINDLSSDI